LPVRIALRKFGSVDDGEMGFVKGILEECYLRLEPHEVSYVDLYLFESATRMKAFYLREKFAVGVVSLGFDDLFVAQHDAWRGTPRISICLERLRSLPRDVQVGSIRHEAGHSVLHGGIECYIVPSLLMPRLAAEIGFSEESTRNYLYLMSIAVKDYEVARFLLGREFFEDQLAYATNIIDTTDDDRLAWRMSRGNRVAEILCMASRFKEMCCAAPFLRDERIGKELEDKIVGNLSYLDGDNVKRLLRVAKDDLPTLGTDTTRNIDLLSDLLLRAFMGV